MGIKRNKRSSKAVVGLDIDPSHVAAAEVSVNGSITVKRSAVERLRPGTLRDGEVTDAVALTEAIRKLWSENELPDHVRIGIANQRVVVRVLDLPPLQDEKALATAVRVEAPDHIPMPMDEAVIDFQPLGMVETPDGPRSRVLIVAVRREMVDRLVAAVQDAGLKVDGVDLSAFGMVRALAPLPGQPAQLYVNVAGLTNVAVANAEGCLFTRAATGGLDAMVNTLAERRGLTLEHAEQWLRHVGLETPLDEVEGDAEVVAAARAVLEEGVHQLADTVRNSLNFFRMQDGAEKVESGVLVGPATAIPGFAKQLSEQLRLPLIASSLGVAGDAAGEDRITVAAGLAVEETAH